jgi:hypothetical protein
MGGARAVILGNMPAQAIPFRDERVHARDSWQRGWVKPTALPSLVLLVNACDPSRALMGIHKVNRVLARWQ